MWQRPELWFKPFAKLPGERLSRESMLFLLWISRSTTKMPTADCQGQWAQSGRTEWASPRCPSELDHFCVVIFQHSRGKMVKIHPSRFWFILFAIFLFLSFVVVVFMGASRLVCVHKVYTLMQSLQISPQPHIPASTSTFSGDVVVTRIDLFMFIKWKLAQGAPDEATPHF